MEKKVREDTQSRIFKMIEDIYHKWDNEINEEINERENNTENLLNLLEETCSKLDSNFN